MTLAGVWEATLPGTLTPAVVTCFLPPELRTASEPPATNLQSLLFKGQRLWLIFEILFSWASYKSDVQGPAQTTTQVGGAAAGRCPEGWSRSLAPVSVG